MNIVHIAYLDHFRSDGIMTVLDSLVREQKILGHGVYILNICNKKIIDKEEVHLNHFIDFRLQIDTIKPDVVIFHSIYWFAYYRFAKYLRKIEIPYLVQTHGGTVSEAQRRKCWKKIPVNILFVHTFIHNSAGVIYLNQQECDKCIFKRQRRSQYIIPNGIQNADISIIPNSFQKKNLNFIFLSRIDINQKGIDYLLKAWMKFRKESVVNCHLYIYGDIQTKKDKSIFYRLLEECDDSVSYHGQVRGGAKASVFIDADVFVLTSRFEGMPMSVLEALSYGLPCLISPNTNMQYIIQNNDCGWVTELNAEFIKNSLLHIVQENSERMNRLKQNAISTASSFSWSNIAQVSIRAYQSVLLRSEK